VAQSLFSVGGLASGMDSNAIVDKLVELESLPLQTLQKRQSAFRTQISILGDLASRVAALKSAASSLATGGVLATQATSTNTSFTAVPGSGAIAGSYDVQVGTLARAAKWRSGPFGGVDVLQAGTLTLTVDGVTYPPVGDPDHPPIAITGSTSLASVADAIRASGAPVSVAVLDDGTRKYLSVTARSTGYQTDAALTVGFTPADPPDAGVDLRTGQYAEDAANAGFTIDNLAFVRTSNTISDALPGTTLTLKAGGGARETLSIANDVAGTRARLQGYVDAYNALMSAVKGQLAVSAGTDRARTLAGDGTVRQLQQALGALGSATVPGLSTVRSLADLGLKSGRDGTLSIDDATLAGAVARDPAAVNAVFAGATNGISRLVTALADTFTAPSTGLLVSRQSGLEKQIRALDARALELQARIDAFRAGLVAQFTAMEKVVGQLKNVGNFLTMQENAARSS
jgi:flagellar hook-associated protein 2